MRRDYSKLAVEQFGRQLLTSGDLDPVYIALPQAIQEVKQLHRWLISYWCFYHCGVASWLSEQEGDAFWKGMLLAAHNEQESPLGGRWPRGQERRHARGAQGIKMVTHLRERYGTEPETMVSDLSKMGGGGVVFSAMATHIKTHSLFGPWIAFKVCDMMERIIGVPVNFDQADVFMFKDPVKAALMLWREKVGLPEGAKPKDEGAAIREIVAYLKDEFKDLKAPPLHDRPVELQEVETVLCKWKSHMNGHYPLFNDIDEINEGLHGWGETAERFLQAMPAAHLYR